MALRAGDGLELTADRTGQDAEIELLALELNPAGVQAREIEQIGRELRQPRHLLAGGAEELLPRRLVELLVVEQLEEAPEREDRRPQLVRRVRDELPPRALEPGQAQAHPVERRGELADLVAAAVDDRLVEAAARDPVGGPFEAPQPPGEEVGGAVPERQRKQKRDRPGEQQPAANELDVRERVLERSAEDEHDVLRERDRRLRVRLVVALEPPALRLVRFSGRRTAIGSSICATTSTASPRAGARSGRSPRRSGSTIITRAFTLGALSSTKICHRAEGRHLERARFSPSGTSWSIFESTRFRSRIGTRPA